MNLLARMSILVVLACLFSWDVARADTFNIRSYGALPNDAVDDAPAFRAAYAAAAAFGGTVYVPAGQWLFSSADPLDPNSHVVVRHPGIRVTGDARGVDTFANLAQGSEIHSTSNSRAVFTLAQASIDDIPGGTTSFPNGFILENITISRLDFSGSGGLTKGAVGVMFKNLEYNGTFGRELSIYNVLFNNVNIHRHYDGVRAERGTDNGMPPLQVFAKPTSFRVYSSEFAFNDQNGMTMEDFGGLRIVASDFVENGADGLRIRSHVNFFGTAQISDCGFYGNGGAGFTARGERDLDEFNAAQDIMVTGCQFDFNDREGVAVTQAKHVQFTGCMFSANGRLESGSPLPGLYAGDVLSFSVTGCGFQSNEGSGAVFADCRGTAVSGCSFNFNDNDGNGVADRHALVVSAGRQQSFSAITFTSSATQKLGILLQFDPVGLVMTGVTFETGMTTLISQFGNTAAAEFVIDYFSGTAYTRLED